MLPRIAGLGLLRWVATRRRLLPRVPGRRWLLRAGSRLAGERRGLLRRRLLSWDGGGALGLLGVTIRWAWRFVGHRLGPPVGAMK